MNPVHISGKLNTHLGSHTGFYIDATLSCKLLENGLLPPPRPSIDLNNSPGGVLGAF